MVCRSRLFTLKSIALLLEVLVQITVRFGLVFCREALLEYVSQNCCYGSRPAKKYKIRAIDVRCFAVSFFFLVEAHLR